MVDTTTQSQMYHHDTFCNSSYIFLSIFSSQTSTLDCHLNSFWLFCFAPLIYVFQTSSIDLASDKNSPIHMCRCLVISFFHHIALRFLAMTHKGLVFFNLFCYILPHIIAWMCVL